MDKKLFGFVLAIFVLLCVSCVLGYTVTQTSPAADYFFASSTAELNFTCVGNKSAYNATLTIDNALNMTWINGTGKVLNNTVTNFTVAGLAENTKYVWKVQCAGGEPADATNSTPRNFTIDTVKPQNIIQVGPTNSAWNHSNSVIFTFTPQENNFFGCFVELNGVYNKTNTSAIENGSVNSITIAGLAESSSTSWSVKCNDSAGNFNRTGNWTVKIDTTVPESVIYMPSITVIGAQRPITIKCHASDATSGVYEVTAVIRDPSGKEFTQSTREADLTAEFSGLDVGRTGEYTAYCKVEDATGTTNYPFGNFGLSEEKTFTVLAKMGRAGVTKPEAEVAKKVDVDISTKGAKGTLSGKQGESKTFTLDDGKTTHKVFFTKISLDKVTLEIESEPLTVELNVKESKEVDIDRDGEADTKVTLDSIVDEKASVTLERISVAPKAGEVTTPEEEVSGKTALWVTLIVILVIIVVVYFAVKGKKRRY